MSRPKSTSGKWTDVASVPFTGEGGWGPLLLTDGSVIIKQRSPAPPDWYKLTPDKKGKYTDGTWKQIASMPSGYQPDFYRLASPDQWQRVDRGRRIQRKQRRLDQQGRDL